jgi:hypothetical protein
MRRKTEHTSNAKVTIGRKLTGNKFSSTARADQSKKGPPQNNTPNSPVRHASNSSRTIGKAYSRSAVGRSKNTFASLAIEFVEGWRYFLRIAWPLLGILAVQAYLSLGLVWSNTAFTDEALYLQSGHLEINHWLHGTAIPAFPTYFSGSPVIYPPLGALADSVGGLAGARVLSLIFMLYATSLLWAAASKLYGSIAGFFAAGIFAVIGPTLRLGAFATFDALSLLLMALATYCVIRAAGQERKIGWLVAGVFALAAANATKYATALFDPVVAGILLILAAQTNTARKALAKCGVMMAYVAGLLLFLFSLGGAEYATGVEQTTLARATSADQASAVFSESWHLTAVIVVLSIAALTLSLLFDRGLPQKLLLALLATAVVLVPLEQARIHTLTSLNKHVDFGAWFGALAVGYMASRIVQFIKIRPLMWLTTALSAVALFFPARIGLEQAQDIFRGWPNSSVIVSSLGQVLQNTAGPILFDDNRAVPQYYIPTAGAQWYRWSNDSSLRLPDGKSISVGVGHDPSPSLYVARVNTGYFSVVVLNYGSAAVLDSYLLPALKSNPHYHLQVTIPRGHHASQIWLYQPQERFRNEKLGPQTIGNGSPIVTLLTPVARLRPILKIIEAAVVASSIAVVILIFLIRFGWRRGKAYDEI